MPVLKQDAAQKSEVETLRVALQALYDRYCTDEDGWSIEPECHHLARRALGIEKPQSGP